MADKFKCHDCGKEFPSIELRDRHSMEHRFVYLKLSVADLNYLLLFIMQRDERLLTPSLMKELFKHSRN